MSYVLCRSYITCGAFFFILVCNPFPGLWACKTPLLQRFQDLVCAPLSEETRTNLLQPFLRKKDCTNEEENLLPQMNEALKAAFLIFHHARLHSKTDNPFKLQFAFFLASLPLQLPHPTLIASYCNGFTLQEQLLQELDGYQEHIENNKKKEKGPSFVNAYTLSDELQILHYISYCHATKLPYYTTLKRKDHPLIITMDAIRLFGNEVRMEYDYKGSDLKQITNSSILYKHWHFIDTIKVFEKQARRTKTILALLQQPPSILIVGTIQGRAPTKLLFKRGTDSSSAVEYTLMNFSCTFSSTSSDPSLYPLALTTTFMNRDSSSSFVTFNSNNAPSEPTAFFSITKYIAMNTLNRQQSYPDAYNFCYHLNTPIEKTAKKANFPSMTRSISF